MKVIAIFSTLPAELPIAAAGERPRVAMQVRRIPTPEGPSHVSASKPDLKPHAFTPTQEHVTLVEYSLADDAFELAHTIADKLRALGAEVSVV